MLRESSPKPFVLGQEIPGDKFVRQIKKNGTVIIGEFTPEQNNDYRTILRSSLQELHPDKFARKVKQAKHGGTDREFLSEAITKFVARVVNRNIKKSSISQEDKDKMVRLTAPGMILLRYALEEPQALQMLLDSNANFSHDSYLNDQVIGQEMCPAIAFSRVIILQALPFLPTD